jgi:hypothetical protein
LTGSFSAVTITIGIRFVSRLRLSWSQIVKPSMSGSIKSRRIRSGALERTESMT